MYIVMFINSEGKSRQIGKVKTPIQAYCAINKFLEEHHFKSYYTRTWQTNEKTTVVDVGSHTEFFQIIEQ